MKKYEKALREVQIAQFAFDKAKETLDETKAALIKLIGTKIEGTTKQDIGNFNCTTTGKLNYSVNEDEIDAVGELIDEETFDKIFSYKWSVNVKYLKEVREHDKKLYKKIAKAVTSKPAKDSLKIEEKKEKK